jgi:hypothetical protein
MRAFLIIGICGVFFSQMVTAHSETTNENKLRFAQDRVGCLLACENTSFACRQACPPPSPANPNCVANCNGQESTCKARCPGNPLLSK